MASTVKAPLLGTQDDRDVFMKAVLTERDPRCLPSTRTARENFDRRPAAEQGRGHVYEAVHPAEERRGSVRVGRRARRDGDGSVPSSTRSSSGRACATRPWSRDTARWRNMNTTGRWRRVFEYRVLEIIIPKTSTTMRSICRGFRSGR
jgi:hypothetical protein